MNIIETVDRRIDELKKSLVNLQNNANAHIGAIKTLEDLKKELETPEKELHATETSKQS